MSFTELLIDHPFKVNIGERGSDDKSLKMSAIRIWEFGHFNEFEREKPFNNT